ncbi:Cas4 exonuclease [Mycobacterium phage Myxus]|uniref:Cas4 exonuclease n=6 Tax=Fromanvirus packman TaxID=1034142 RepID=G1BR80_9CAUD|nr:exonuclease [Mycobacterium phage Catalina]YP_009636044.1 exonuclease [Mycobacterium phage PackMan]AMO43943.1 Cas4 exonuclease [Mycobacterium phage Myxus]AOQ29032.1 Cas4 exonuclease [Mycobacterium phage HortumSL17]AOY12027.1 Cas4 exonuclease [Mycobacterium phage Phaeder]AVI04181.1 Cas4 exonuclease [Mycobacterium phage Phonnegut]QDF20177.1 Cas4 exonuclease [Mycobacterium phage Tubs]QGH80542.1 Cas4 exonuclease [Mycobacterium phage Aliter]QGJ88725.1 Cas4 exonuclease [Mycobacterium phage Beem
MTLAGQKIPLRSVSQLNQYTRCPMAYKLARIDKVWARPAAWLPQGTAFHTVAEIVEKARAEGREVPLEKAQEIFKEEYAKDIGELSAITPNFDWWFGSGPYNAWRDIERRFHVGLEQVEKFYAWRSMQGQEIWWTPAKDDEPSKPAIELQFNIVIDTPAGPIRLRGFIDAVVVLPDGSIRVRDYKTGNKPGDDFQLGVYALVIKLLYGVEVTTGDYFMAGKKGKKPTLTHPFDLSEWTLEAVAEKFAEVEEGIRAEKFEALPEPDKCNFCDVSYSCPVYQ